MALIRSVEIGDRDSGNKRRDLISVCICTYKRPELLAWLLDELRNQLTGDLFDYSVVIVDNDASGSARGVTSSATEKSNFEINYAMEPIQNISLARNQSLRMARGNLIAFIDDDEIPKNSWLLDLYKALHHYRVDGALGPVHPYYRTSPPSWVKRGGFYDRPTYPTGLIIDWPKGRTGNLLLKREMIDATGEMFDPKFGSGGEDQDFIRRMIARGYIFVWCNEAKAYELVSPIRWNRSFMIKRALLRGKMAAAKPVPLFLAIGESLIAVPVYTLALPVLFLLGHHWFMRYLIKDFDHIGRILGFLKIDVVKQKYVTE